MKKKPLRIVVLIMGMIILSSFNICIYSQVDTTLIQPNQLPMRKKIEVPKPQVKWEKLCSNVDYICIEFPKNFATFTWAKEFYKDNNQNVKFIEWRVLTAYLNGGVLVLETFKANKMKEAFTVLKKDYLKGTNANGTSQTEEQLEFLEGMSYVSQQKDRYAVTQFYSGKEFVYVVKAIARDENNEVLKRFLSSIKLVADLSKETQPQSATDLDEVVDDKVYEKSETTLNAKPVWMPYPYYPIDARSQRKGGKIEISVVLSADGTVRELKALNDLGYGMTEAAIDAAKKMRFLPAEREGQIVSQRETIVYHFRSN